jgi:KAP-like P-loop domain-containing protein
MFPAKNLRDAYNAVDPTLPLPPGDPRYVNCDDVRGNEDTVAQMFKTISYSDADTHQLLTGHRGCGKSTELLRLKDRLEREDFWVIYFAVDDYLDPNDLTYTDLLLSIARRAEDEFRKGGIDLDQALKTIERWFSEVVFRQREWETLQQQLETEASLGFGLPGVPIIARLLARLTGQIKTGNEIKGEIRHTLDRQISQLIEQLNNLLLTAQAKVRSHNKRGVVIIVDNLDRITLKDLSDGRTSHDALFIDHGEQLCALECHTVYTVPISMMYSLKAMVLRGIFPDSRVLPMIKIHESHAKGGLASADGLAHMLQILSHRVDIADLAETEAMTYLCHASGGHPRDLMALVRHSIEYADETLDRPLTLDVARHAEARLVSAFGRMIPENSFGKLVKVHLENRIQNDSDHQKMLFSLSVLEYANGVEPWHDVHPAVQKLSRFRQALRNERGKLPTDERRKRR